MVTHDVDESLFLSDRIVMMTDGPAAEVGDILEVPFPRPRERKAVMEHPDYYRLREHLLEFLQVHAHRKKTVAGTDPASVLPLPPAADAPAQHALNSSRCATHNPHARETAIIHA